MKRIALRPSPRAGGALIFAVIVLTALMALSAAMLRVGASSSKATNSGVDDRRAFYLAESGAAEALTAIRTGATGAVGSQATPARNGDGLFWVTSSDAGGGRRQLVVTAMCGSGRSALEVVVETATSPQFRETVRSDKLLFLHSWVQVDSFDSSVGTYASQATNTLSGRTYANANGHVASNTDIHLHAQASVFGDASPGPGKSISFGAGSFVTGSTAPSPTTWTLPPIEVPALVTSGPFTVPNGGSRTIPAGDHRFDDLTIGNNGTLIVRGPANIVMDDFAVSSSNLVIDASGGPVTFFCEGDFGWDEDFLVTASPGSPMDLAWNITETGTVTIPQHSTLVGGFYAPDALFDLRNHCEVFGALASEEVKMTTHTAFHFDEYLLNREQTSGSSETKIVSWKPTQLSSTSFGTNRGDPFRMLGVDRNTLPVPADAWDL